MKVVSDTTPISNFLQIGELKILKNLFSNVLIPQAVHEEILALEQLGISTKEYQQATWLQVKPIQSSLLSTQLAKDLDKGETEAISLSVDLSADLLLVDERKGRDMAVGQGLKIMGTLGILLMAKQQHQLADISEVLNQLRQIGFWFSNALYDKVLALSERI